MWVVILIDVASQVVGDQAGGSNTEKRGQGDRSTPMLRVTVGPTGRSDRRLQSQASGG